MASSSDKARFYLEQSVPDLREYERKAIFSREEISAITRKRAEFEHILNGPGALASTYARYIEYEMNLDALRRKRVRRLGVKARDHAGPKRIFALLKRATARHPGDLALWMQYVDYARRERAHKRLEEIWTQVLRLHPTKHELWIAAARGAAEADGDVAAGRTYLQRGMRFCSRCRPLWREYMKLEMLYIAKIEGRRQVFANAGKLSAPQLDQNLKEGEETDIIQLPEVSQEEMEGAATDSSAFDKLRPILDGAIPISVFDGAMKDFDGDLVFAEELFDMVTDFGALPCARTILQHILDAMRAQDDSDPRTTLCALRLALTGASPSDPVFPPALGNALTQITLLRNDPSLASLVVHRAIASLLPFLRHDDLDPALRKVLNASIRRLANAQADADPKDSHALGAIVRRLEKAGRSEDAHALTELAPPAPTQPDAGE